MSDILPRLKAGDIGDAEGHWPEYVFIKMYHWMFVLSGTVHFNIILRETLNESSQ
jgi:hypothetical protein